jgi:hypothetical protein
MLQRKNKQNPFRDREMKKNRLSSAACAWGAVFFASSPNPFGNKGGLYLLFSAKSGISAK